MDALGDVYREAYSQLRERASIRDRSAEFRVRFYPYAGIKSIVYKRSDHYEVKLVDLLAEAPTRVHESLAKILLSKLDRRFTLRPSDRSAYEAWTRTPEIVEKHSAARRARGVKKIWPPQGFVYDLEEMFNRLNAQYFGGTLPTCQVGWSRRRSRTLWGHHDDAHQAIVLNCVLDNPRVPAYVVESILYHEMLHHKIGPRFGRGRKRILHGREMRTEERKFTHYAQAQTFLQAVANRKIRLT